MGPFDTTPVRLDKVKYTKGEQAEMKLDVGDPLRPISEVGTGRAKTDPKMVALAEVIEMLNQLFGGDMFAQHQQQSWIESVIRALLPDPYLVQQAKANTLQEFTESEDFKNAVRSTIMENQQAFDKISEIAATNVSFQDKFISKLAKAFHVWATTPDEPIGASQK
jgi:type I restriction enzyme, R subunit